MSTGIICQTDLSQVDIIRQTFDFLKHNKRIPRISEIDSSARIVKYPFPDLLKGMKLTNNEQQIHFLKFKLFFTDMIDYNSFPFSSIFWRPHKYPEYQFFKVVAQESGQVNLSSVQTEILDTYIDELSIDSDDNNSNQSNDITKSNDVGNKRNIRRVKLYTKQITKTRIV